jgi:NAD(P)-dependent dehydrogenase (short-subunit alcohol dehydrogenase family)
MTQRSALVTGAARRIGAHIAKHLGNKGYHVFVHTHRSLEEAGDVVRRIAAAGGSAEVVRADIGSREEIDRLMRTVKSHPARLAVLVNNASLFEYDFPLAADLPLLRRSIDVHIVGPALLFEHLKDIAAADNDVTIVNMLDQKLRNLNPDYYSYTLGKMGLDGLTQIWQSAQIPHIRTFGILLGLTMISGRQSRENFDIASRSNPAMRAPRLEEIAALIDYFLEHKTLTGQTLALDGGASLVRRLRDVAFDAALHARGKAD